MKFAWLPTRLESILEREFALGHSHLRLVGSSSPVALAQLLCGANSTKITNLPHLVVMPSLADAERFRAAVEFFDSGRRVSLLTHFDVSPYSGLYPKPQAVAERMRFLHEAIHAQPNAIFVAPTASLQQRCLPLQVLAKASLQLRVDQDLPENFAARLNACGYQASPLTEDVGQFSQRGGIVDVFSPAQDFPLRLELFGDTIVSIRQFNPQNQHSGEELLQSAWIIPCRETIFTEAEHENLLQRFRHSVLDRPVDKGEFEETLRSLARETAVDGLDFLLPSFYPHLATPLEMFSSPLHIWLADPIEVRRLGDDWLENLRSEFRSSQSQLVRPQLEALFATWDELHFPADSTWVEMSPIQTEDFGDDSAEQKISTIEYRSFGTLDLSTVLAAQTAGNEPWSGHAKGKLQAWQKDGYRVVVGVRNRTQAERLRLLLQNLEVATQIHETHDFAWHDWLPQPGDHEGLVHLVLRPLPESVRIPEEQIVFLRDEDFLGKRARAAGTRSSASAADEFQKQARRLSFGDLKPGDCVVHLKHGIGVYEGLRVMNIGGADSEFMQIQYKGNDKLYMPVYRVGQLQKFSGAAATAVLDKLGGPGWEKTKTKVRSHLRDIASELLVLYAKRQEMQRPAFAVSSEDLAAFENSFLYDETEDQMRAIQDVLGDLRGTRPMDRLICGDVGYGKTEVAMRAAFVAARAGFQVAVLAPTTVLSFQHFETFRKRFAGWNLEIRELNRFVSPADVKKTLTDLKAGKVDLIVGTHRLLSRDVQFAKLGLLIVDEEQKFGVAHKERVKKMRTEVDTLTMSATPIPRTLNMSLVGIRDLSLINTAPVDRMPTRTFITKWDDDMIRKAVTAEIKRGGQVFFIHNRIQSIFGIADELRKIVPEARIKIGHGQMDEEELEKTMVQFFNHEIDILLCTTIVESGMDIPKANTMFIDQAQLYGLSQLYQLRGRVGRSKQRAYCYLLLPRGRQLEKDAQERLKVIQENSALGSGIRIAQYDLELRGAGNLLGEEQSGHINTVGYELYMDLLNEAIASLRGEDVETEPLEPEINLRIPALIPDSYIADIRLRLSYYKALAEIDGTEDLDRIESELRDQFGEPPEPTQNLMGLMLIRSLCRQLSIRDLSAGLKNVSLVFTEKTPLKSDVVIRLAMRENKKYSLTPDQRLNIRMNTVTWPAVFEELRYLISLI